MSLESDLEESTRRIEEATELLDGGPIDIAHGTVKGLVAIADGVKSCANHPLQFAKGMLDWWSE